MSSFLADQISAIHIRSTALIIHSLNRPTGFSGPKAKAKPKLRLGARKAQQGPSSSWEPQKPIKLKNLILKDENFKLYLRILNELM